MTVASADSLGTVSEDELETNEATVKKPKSSKKKKKKKSKEVIVDHDDDETTPTTKSKKEKKKKKKATTVSDDDNVDSQNFAYGSNNKLMSIKQEKTSISTVSIGTLSEEEKLIGDEKPKSVKSKKKTKTIEIDAVVHDHVRHGGGPAGGRGPSESFRASQRGRGPTSNGRGYLPSNSATAMKTSGHNPYHRAPTRPQSMRVGGGPSPGGRGSAGSLGSSSAHNPSMRAPGRHSSMVQANGGRGGRGGGRAGSSMRSSLHAGSSHGGNGSTQQPIRPIGRPASILRTSTHGGRGAGAVIVGPDGTIRHLDNRRNSKILGSGSTHRAQNTSSHNFQSNYNNRRTASDQQMERSDSVDSFAIDYDDIEGDSPQDNVDGVALVSGFPGMVENLSKSIRSLMDVSSQSGREASVDRRNGLGRGLSLFNASTRSILTFEWDDSDEGLCVRTLRYVRLMAPHPNEKPLKKKIRIITWTELVLDLLGAIVAITTYGGVTMCCGEPMMNVAGNFPWEKSITVVT
jgi:hypothetical protein